MITNWASGRCTMPRTACRVVCGLEEAMTIFLPTSALVRVDLPAFGLPTRQAKPDRKGGDSVMIYRSRVIDPVNVSTKCCETTPERPIWGSFWRL